jgi:amidase
MVASIFKRFTSVGSLFTTLSLSALRFAGSARAFNYVADARHLVGHSGRRPPVVDTGSIRATQVGPGQAAGFSTSINGFGGLKVLVPTEHGSYDPQLLFNGEMMRGFGLTFDGVNRFATTQSIDLGVPLGPHQQRRELGPLARQLH